MPKLQPEPSGELTVYRAVHGASVAEASVLESLRSNKDLGKPPRPGSAEQTNPFVHEGISCWQTEAAVRAMMARYPALGDHVARIALAADGDAVVAWWERPPGHLTVRAKADDLLSAIVSIA